MKKILFMLLTVLTLSFFVNAANAEAPRATKQEAQAMTEKAAQWFKEKGKDATFAAISNKDDKDFHDRELYVFAYDKDGNCVAHGSKPGLIGKNLINLKDSDGKLMIKEIVGVAKTGWVDFKWQNPTTNQVEPKSAYVVHEGDFWFGVGAYNTGK